MKSRHLILFVVLFATISSCVPVKKLKYTQDSSENEMINSYVNQRSIKTIQPYDNIYIKVYSLDEKTNKIFETNSYNMFGENLNLVSYTVDESGSIDFPFIGKIFVKDLTIQEAQKVIFDNLSQYLPNISVVAKFVGNKVTLLGEVRRPGEYNYYNDKLTVFQAIGFAGGISDFGNKSNVTLIREIDNVITYYDLDLTKKEIVKSKYYYLLPNDVIIIEPLRAKYRNLRDYSLISTTLSIISTVILILTYNNKN